MSRRGKAFTPQRTKDAEAHLAQQYSGPKFEGNVGIDICLNSDSVAVSIWDLDYLAENVLRGDVDNYAKTVLDALNGLAWEDDRQVKYICVYMAER